MERGGAALRRALEIHALVLESCLSEADEADFDVHGPAGRSARDLDPVALPNGRRCLRSVSMFRADPIETQMTCSAERVCARHVFVSDGGVR